MTDKLYFDDILIGDITPRESEFPTFNGGFILRLTKTNNLSDRLLKYIDHSMRYDRYFASFEGAVSYEPQDNELNNLEREESDFQDLMDSDKWKIIEADGKQIKILIPTFGFDNSITYRPNID